MLFVTESVSPFLMIITGVDLQSRGMGPLMVGFFRLNRARKLLTILLPRPGTCDHHIRWLRQVCYRKRFLFHAVPRPTFLRIEQVSQTSTRGLGQYGMMNPNLQVTRAVIAPAPNQTVDARSCNVARLRYTLHFAMYCSYVGKCL